MSIDSSSPSKKNRLAVLPKQNLSTSTPCPVPIKYLLDEVPRSANLLNVYSKQKAGETEEQYLSRLVRDCKIADANLVNEKWNDNEADHKQIKALRITTKFLAARDQSEESSMVERLGIAGIAGITRSLHTSCETSLFTKMTRSITFNKR